MRICLGIEKDGDAPCSSHHCLVMSTSRLQDPTNASDYVQLVLMILAILFNFSMLVVFGLLRLKKQVRVYTPAWLAPASWTVGVIHIISVFVSYGFFSDSIGPAVLTPACSLWTFWLQYVLGFSAWIMFLCMRLVGVAITTISDFKIDSARRRFLFRLFCALGLLTPMVFIGSVAEATGSAFYVAPDGVDCRTAMLVKLCILVWLVAVCAFFIVCSIYVRRRSVLADMELVVGVEMAIAKASAPILVICSLLNFSGLVSYWWGRAVFLMLVVLMHSWSCWLMAGRHVKQYDWSRVPLCRSFSRLIWRRGRRRPEASGFARADYDDTEDDDVSSEEFSDGSALFDFGSSARARSVAECVLSPEGDDYDSDDAITTRTRVRHRMLNDSAAFQTLVDFVLSSDKTVRKDKQVGSENGLYIDYVDIDPRDAASGGGASSSSAAAGGFVEIDISDNSDEEASIYAVSAGDPHGMTEPPKTSHVSVVQWCACMRDVGNLCVRINNADISEEDAMPAVVRIIDDYIHDASSILSNKDKRAAVDRSLGSAKKLRKKKRRLRCIRRHRTVDELVSVCTSESIRDRPGALAAALANLLSLLEGHVMDQYFGMWYDRGGHARIQRAGVEQAAAIAALQEDSGMMSPFSSSAKRLIVDDPYLHDEA